MWLKDEIMKNNGGKPIILPDSILNPKLPSVGGGGGGASLRRGLSDVGPIGKKKGALTDNMDDDFSDYSKP